MRAAPSWLVGSCVAGAVALVLLASSGPSRADMSRPVSQSAGSFFAAGLACEGRDLIPRGQVETIMAELDKYLSARNKKWMKEGFEEGKKKSKVLVPGRGWVDSAADEAECYRVQGVLDEYKGILGGSQ